MLSQEQKEKLTQCVNAGISNLGKSISNEDLKKVIEIMSPYYVDLDRENLTANDWELDWGLCVYYLRFANLEATVDPLMELATIDQKINIFMGYKNLEHFVFANKAIKIILDKPVRHGPNF